MAPFRSMPQPEANEQSQIGAENEYTYEQYQHATENTTSSTDDEESLFNRGYISVAYYYTPYDYGLRQRNVDQRRGGIVGSIAYLGRTGKEAALKAQEISQQEAKYQEEKQKALEIGISIWEGLANKGHLQSQIGLAWHFGVNNIHKKAYFWRKLALANGDKESSVFLKYHEKNLDSETIEQLDIEVGHFLAK